MDTGNLLQCQKEENGLDGGVDFHSLVCCSLLCGIGFDMFVKKLFSDLHVTVFHPDSSLDLFSRKWFLKVGSYTWHRASAQTEFANFPTTNLATFMFLLM